MASLEQSHGGGGDQRHRDHTEVRIASAMA
jgi:hypothetical protein